MLPRVGARRATYVTLYAVDGWPRPARRAVRSLDILAAPKYLNALTLTGPLDGNPQRQRRSVFTHQTGVGMRAIQPNWGPLMSRG
jgi:hypothetical protein